jgi:hypothetical protein
VLPNGAAQPRSRAAPTLPRAPSITIRPILVEPLTSPPKLVLPGSADKRIDWEAEARRAAQRVVDTPRFRGFGRDETDRAAVPTRSPPPHHAGENYQDVYGDRVYWVSDSCYVVAANALQSAVSALNAPGPVPEALPRTVCTGSDSPTTDRFNDLLEALPAYRKSHPQ